MQLVDSYYKKSTMLYIKVKVITNIQLYIHCTTFLIWLLVVNLVRICNVLNDKPCFRHSIYQSFSRVWPQTPSLLGRYFTFWLVGAKTLEYACTLKMVQTSLAYSCCHRVFVHSSQLTFQTRGWREGTFLKNQLTYVGVMNC